MKQVEESKKFSSKSDKNAESKCFRFAKSSLAMSSQVFQGPETTKSRA